MKRLFALALLAGCSSNTGSTTPTGTTTIPPTDIRTGPALDGLNSNWFEATDPDGRTYWCLFVGWDQPGDEWNNVPRTGAHSIDCQQTLEFTP
jgi:hypothetical protein